MTTRQLICAGFLGCALMIGCDDQKETPAGTPAPTPQASESAAKETKAKAEDASERAKDTIADASKITKAQAESAADSLKKNADAAANAVATMPAASGADTQIKQALDYIRDHKLDLAEKTLAEVETNKSSLPIAVQAQVVSARQMLDAAKKGAATTQPAK